MRIKADDHPRVIGHHPISWSFRERHIIGFFDDPTPDAAAQARALLLVLLRDRSPGDEAYPALAEAAGSYLRLYPDDVEMQEAWDAFINRLAEADRCAHNGFLLLEPADGGCAVRCVLCGTVGPVRSTSEAARKALLGLGTRSGA